MKNTSPSVMSHVLCVPNRVDVIDKRPKQLVIGYAERESHWEATKRICLCCGVSRGKAFMTSILMILVIKKL
jgi:hypothetical protein